MAYLTDVLILNILFAVGDCSISTHVCGEIVAVVAETADNIGCVVLNTVGVNVGGNAKVVVQGVCGLTRHTVIRVEKVSVAIGNGLGSTKRRRSCGQIKPIVTVDTD